MFEADRNLGVNRWPIVRVASGRRTEVMLLGGKYFCLTTHWLGYSIPCVVDDCPLCDQLAARGLWYLAVKWDSRTSLLELGSVSASNVEHNAKLMGGGMRAGVVLELGRHGPKKPVMSEFVRFVDGVAPIDYIDLVRHVMCLYKFPPPNPGDDVNAYEKRCRQIARVRCERLAKLASNAIEKEMAERSKGGLGTR